MTKKNVSIEVTQEASGVATGWSPLLKIDEIKMEAWVDRQVKNAVEDDLNEIMESVYEFL